MTHKYISGPYYVSQFHQMYGLWAGDGSTIIKADNADGEGFVVARVNCQTPYKPGEGQKTQCALRDATAPLIAAAPELAEALEAMISIVTHYGDLLYDAEVLAVEQARAALTKAKGE